MLTLAVGGIDEKGWISPDYAFGVKDDHNPVILGRNLNPHVSWHNVPEGTKSCALVLHDPDVPASAEKVNQNGETIPVDFPRMDFIHWAIVNIPPTITEIPEGAVSDSVVIGGKEPGQTAYGTTGVNDYTKWFKTDEKMNGAYGGYDGPCPPWNDEKPHRYIFTLYALDVTHCTVPNPFTGSEALKALRPHILGQAQMTGMYSLNPAIV